MWNAAKGYGFATPDDGGEDVFLHVTQFRPRIDPAHVTAGREVYWGALTSRNGKVQAAEISLRQRLRAEHAMNEYVAARVRKRWHDAGRFRAEMEADFIQRVRADPADAWSVYSQAADSLVDAQLDQGESHRNRQYDGPDGRFERTTESWYEVEADLASGFEREQPDQWRAVYSPKSYGNGGSFGWRAKAHGASEPPKPRRWWQRG